MAYENGDDAALLRRQRLFLEEIERSVRESNRELIHDRIPVLDREGFVHFARVVARLRAAYLEAAFLASEHEDLAQSQPGWVERLRGHREAYEEARLAFEALQRSIERGYVDIGAAA